MNQISGDSSRSGRPLGFSRQSSIEAAMNLFWEKGVLPVSNKDLASAMGIQRSSFYNTFKNKEAVFGEVLALYGETAPDRHLENIQPGQPVVPELIRFLKDLCRIRASDPKGRGCLVCNGIAELSTSDTAMGDTLTSILDERIGLMKSLFAQSIKLGEIDRNLKPGELAQGFMTFLLGLNIISKVVRDERQLWKICRTYLQGIGIDPDA